MNIYHTDLDTTDFDLENQLTIEAKVKYAIATDHTHLMDCNDMLFEISVEDEEVILTEVYPECSEEPEEECEYTEESIEDFSISRIIDLIIRNSLLSSEPIAKEQAETMLVLAQLKYMLEKN